MNQDLPQHPVAGSQTHWPRCPLLLHDNINDALARDPDPVSIGCCDHVPLGLIVVGFGLNTEVIAELMDELSLVPVHALEGVGTRFLFGLQQQIKVIKFGGKITLH